MTCIVGIEDEGKVWMGGDRASVSDDHYLTRTATPKVFKRGKYIIGYTSSFRMGQLLQYRLKLPTPPKGRLDKFMATAFVDAVRKCLSEGGYTKVEDGREEAGTFLVGIHGLLYKYECDHQVKRAEENYNAVGCGISVALGSLFTSGQHDLLKPDYEQRIRLALEAAAKFTTGVEPPFDILVSE